MRIHVYIVWYCGLGGHPAISFAGDYLLVNWMNTSVSSFELIEVYAHVPSRSHDPNLSSLSFRFCEHIRDLPKSWLKRKLRRIEVSYNSQLGCEEELVGAGKVKPTVAQFSLACHEVSSAIDIVSKRLKRTDDFPLNAIKEHFAERLELLPRTDAELHDVLHFLRVEDRKRLKP